MTGITLVERPMTDAEFAQSVRGFETHGRQHGNLPEEPERFGFVALEGDRFVGCSSGLAYRHVGGYAHWFFLSDLFVEEPYRRRGIGRELLARLEERLRALGVKYVYTWTAGYEAPGFYRKQGYQEFGALEDWYRSGHARIGFRKAL